MSDAKLKEAMSEIFGVLKKHDIAGQVTLVSQTHSEFRIKINPSWSCAWLEELADGAAIRFKIKKEDVPDKEVRRKTAENTLHMLAQIRDLNGQNFIGFDHALSKLKEHIDFDHTSGSNYEPHREN